MTKGSAQILWLLFENIYPETNHCNEWVELHRRISELPEEAELI
jgi:hypothetical protein